MKKKYSSKSSQHTNSPPHRLLHNHSLQQPQPISPPRPYPFPRKNHGCQTIQARAGGGRGVWCGTAFIGATTRRRGGGGGRHERARFRLPCRLRRGRVAARFRRAPCSNPSTYLATAARGSSGIWDAELPRLRTGGRRRRRRRRRCGCDCGCAVGSARLGSARRVAGAIAVVEYY